VGDVTFNIARGRIAELANRVNANDPANSAFVIVVLQSSGLEADTVLVDYDDLATLLAASNNEATNAGYARIVLTNASSITVTVDDTNNRVVVDFPDQTYTTVAAVGGAWGAVLVCYDSDTTGGTDANIVPMTKHDFGITPSGRDIDLVVGANGFYLDED
jgi:hypothetical protein